MRFTCTDDSLARVHLCLWLLGHHLSWEAVVAALHRHPRSATANWEWDHHRVFASCMKGSWTTLFLPEAWASAQISLFQPPACFAASRQTRWGVPVRCWETQQSLKLELYDWTVWCFQPQVFTDVFAFINSCFQEEILHLMQRDASGFALLPVSSKASALFHSN